MADPGGKPEEPGELTADGCGNCLYMRQLSDTTLHCRRYAPSAAGVGQQAYVWPEIIANDWCGDGRDIATGRPFAEPQPQTYQTSKPVTGKKT